MKNHYGLSSPELASVEAALVDTWERLLMRMGRLALTKGEGEGEGKGLVERRFILYDPSSRSSPRRVEKRPKRAKPLRHLTRSAFPLFARGFAPVDR